MNNFTVETKNLTKYYKKNIGCENVSLHVPKGKIYGLIGPNGAGKTTLLKLISGLSLPTSGEVTLFDSSLKNYYEEFVRIGALIEEPGILPTKTAYENLKLKAISMGLYTHERVLEILELIGLEDSKQKTKDFSTGMKQRLGIGLALIGNPDLLVLDEPINGLDPKGVADIRNLLEHLNNRENITIILSSHMLEELSKLANYYGIIKQGHLLQELSKEELLHQCRKKIEIQTDNPPLALTIITEELKSTDHRVLETGLIEVYDLLDKAGEITTKLVNNNIKVYSITTADESLEDYFLKITGGGIHA